MTNTYITDDVVKESFRSMSDNVDLSRMSAERIWKIALHWAEDYIKESQFKEAAQITEMFNTGGQLDMNAILEAAKNIASDPNANFIKRK